MAVGEVSICNGALTLLGADRINSLTESNKRALACADRYPNVRDQLISSHPWNFAIRRIALAQLTTTPDFEFAYEYQLPSDCLRVLNTDNVDHIYKIEGRNLITDEATISIKYISQITDTSQFPSFFVRALEWSLAKDLSYLMVLSSEKMQQVSDMAKAELAVARSLDAQEGTPEKFFADDWLNARF